MFNSYEAVNEYIYVLKFGTGLFSVQMSKKPLVLIRRYVNIFSKKRGSVVL